MEFLRESFLLLLPALPTLPDHPDALKVVLKDMTVVSHLVSSLGGGGDFVFSSGHIKSCFDHWVVLGHNHDCDDWIMSAQSCQITKSSKILTCLLPGTYLSSLCAEFNCKNSTLAFV